MVLRLVLFSVALLLVVGVNAQNMCGSQGGGRTCAQNGFPTYCCSSSGYCGTTSAYCGTGCQTAASGGYCTGQGTTTTTTTTRPPSTTTTTKSASTSAPSTSLPRKVIYILKTFGSTDIGSTIKTAVDIGFTHVVLAFWVNNVAVCGSRCAADAAQLWQSYGDKSGVLSYIHARNAFLMVSGGGATDYWPVDQGNALGTALAQWAVNNQLDGVDFDVEKVAQGTPIGQFQSTTYYQNVANMLIAATNAARNILGPNRQISHAPQAPYFDPGFGRVYDLVLQSVGSKINFVSIQFYNQFPTSCYQTKDQFFTLSSSGNCFVGASINEISTRVGYPLNNLVVGTYISDGSNFHDPAQFRTWFQAVKTSLGWNAGVMLWRNSDSQTDTSNFLHTIYP